MIKLFIFWEIELTKLVRIAGRGKQTQLLREHQDWSEFFLEQVDLGLKKKPVPHTLLL